MPKKSRKLRKTKRTILLCVEGDAEYAYASFLHKRYFSRASAWFVKLANHHGGSPIQQVVTTKNDEGDFLERFCWVDCDKREFEEAQKLADKVGVVLIVSDPCVEAEILRIQKKRVPKNSSSKTIKSALKATSFQPNTPESYNGILPAIEKQIANGSRNPFERVLSIFKTGKDLPPQ